MRGFFLLGSLLFSLGGGIRVRGFGGILGIGGEEFSIKNGHSQYTND